MTANPDPRSEPEWNLVESLFHRAVELPEGERDAWLAGQAAQAAVRNEVRSLLAANRKMKRIPPPDADPPPAQEPPAVVPAELFGHYRIVRLVGRGGMSAVYLAERADGRFQRSVAVKVMAAHLAGDDFLRRFQNEGQLLAALDHPNIAGLLDGGISPAGYPYLVLEFVAGEPLDGYCDKRKLSILERLHLFQQVCEAVDYAHRNLILHRDLKPDNILVTADGVVKLLDFGTAALMGDHANVTVTRARMMTPRYASPEQLRGERPGPAGDVFSLGVILYELLTGAWPFGNPDSMLSELKRAAGAALPVSLPSAVSEEAAELRGSNPDALRRMLQGRLSAIVCKALENDPAQRYTSIRELTEDLARQREGLPVSASRGRWLHTASRFAARKSGWVAVALIVLATAGLYLYQFRAARRTAESNPKIAESPNRRANDQFRLGYYHWSRHTLDSLQKAADSFRQATELDPNFAPAYAFLADSEARLPEYGVQDPQRIEAGRKAAQRAIELDGSLYVAHAALAWIVYSYDWNWDAAEPEFRRAIDLAPDAALPHQRYGLALISRRRFPEAEAQLRRAQQIDPVDVMPKINLAELWYYEHHFDREEEVLRRVLELDPHYVVAHAMLAKLETVSGRSKEAVAEAEKLYFGPEGGDSWCQQLAEVYARAGRRKDVFQQIARCNAASNVTAGTYVYLGDHQRAIAALEERSRMNDAYMHYLVVDPTYYPLRNEPRFQQLVKKLGL